MEKIAETIKILEEPLDVWDEVERNSIGEEAVHLCDLTDVVRKYINWTNLLPRVTPFYAVKVNNGLNILRVLATLGTGFDCAAKKEIETVLGIGVPASRIIFAHPAKPDVQLEYSRDQGVDTLVFDSAHELHKIKKIAPNAKLVIRISCDAEDALITIGEKYGCNSELEAPGLLALARDLTLKVIGVSFHVGSGCLDFPVYARAIGRAKKLFDIANSFGHNFTLLDLGGGFLGDQNNSLIQCSEIINKALDAHFPGNDVHIIAEPGRYFVNTASTLMTRIHSKRQIIIDEVVAKNMYYINDGVCGSLSCVVSEHSQLVPKIRPTIAVDTPLVVSTIWGPTTYPGDKVVDIAMLPDLPIGELIAFEELGAYSTSLETDFNGILKTKSRYFIEKSILTEFPVLEALFSA